MRDLLNQAVGFLAATCTWIVDALGSGKFWAGAAVAIGTTSIIFWRRRYRCSSVSIGLPFNLGSAAFELSAQDRILAWKMYVRLKTRKAALPFDEDNDLICDVYSSLYELFPIARGLLSEMPMTEVSRPRGVSDLIIRILNDAMRPHMTRYQAAFRHWWDDQVKETRSHGKRPHEIQKAFPAYAELVDDLKRTNTELAKLAEDLLLFARPKRRSWKTWFSRRSVTPTPPTTVSATAPMFIEGGVATERPAQPTHPYDTPANDVSVQTSASDEGSVA